MSYESRAYDEVNNDGFGPDPVVVLVVKGTHDVSRLVNLLNGGSALIEQMELGRRVAHQVARDEGGRAALKLLAAHGGPDFSPPPLSGMTDEDLEARSRAGCRPEAGRDRPPAAHESVGPDDAPAPSASQPRLGDERPAAGGLRAPRARRPAGGDSVTAMNAGWAGPLRAVPDAAKHPLLTVLVRPDDDPADRHATRYMRTDGPNYPWVPVTGRSGSFTTLPVKNHEQVKGWRVQSFTDLLAVLDGEVAR